MRKKSFLRKAGKVVLVLTAICVLLGAISSLVLAMEDNGRGIDDPVTADIKQFPDVPRSHWASAFIMRLTSENAISGYPDNTFGPARSITRAEFVTITVGALLVKPEAPPAGQHWATNIMSLAHESNLLEAGEFAEDTWNQPINRQEMAKIMARASQFIQKEAPETKTSVFTSKISDFTSINDSYQPYIAQAYAKGIVTGYPDGSFGGERQATRAEASTMLVRLFDPAHRLGEISFDPAKDVAADGRMKLAKAEQYLMRNLQSLRFYAENGQFIMEGNLTDLPAGFENFITIHIEFKQGSGLPVESYRSDESIIFHEMVHKLPTFGPFREVVQGISGPEKISDIRVNMAIEALDYDWPPHTDYASEVHWIFYSTNDDRIACIDTVGYSEQYDKFYDFSKIFEW